MSAMPSRRMMQRIVDEVAMHHGVTVDEIMSRSRHREIVAARFDAQAKAYAATGSLSQVGRFFGRDHTSIINALRKAGQ